MGNIQANSCNEMTPEEKFVAVGNLKEHLEQDFVSIGELLSEIKRTGSYKIKGAVNFKDFIEIEYGMSNGMANKLIGIYNTFIKDLDLQSERVQAIGIDKLSIIKPLIKDASFEVQEEWIKTAENLDLDVIRDKVKKIRDQEKEAAKTLKDVLVEQYLENMKGFFNCSGKELNYKLALFFQDADLEKINEVIRGKQRKFEEEIQGVNNA